MAPLTRARRLPRRHRQVRARRPFAARWLSVAWAVASLFGPGGVRTARAAAALPPGTLPVAAGNWLGSGQASAVRNGNTLTIQQASQQAILNWRSFNIAADGTVRFVQPSAAAQVLNRIGDANPSLIQGRLQANGRVYLINANGIVFGAGAQVNAGALVASSLDVPDDLFLAGVLTAAQTGAPAFSGNSGFVRVEAGATLTTPSGGQVWLFAPTVENHGLISTPDGQTLLAAGHKVYLSESTDPGLRGVKLEVSSGGAVLNLGQIVAERGNATLAGLAVNQGGRITATTTVSRNGSIWLQARENADDSGEPGSARAASVTLAAGSITEVLPEASSTDTSTDTQTFLHSTVNLQATGSTAHITMQGNALIHATAGDVSLSTQLTTDAAAAAPSAAPSAARIYLDSQSRIDVAGLSQVSLPMSRNFLSVELRGTELADAPLQKNGVLRGQTVVVDLREGSSLFDVSGAVAQIGRTVAERSTAGGTIALSSAADVVLRQGSKLDVSGGSLAYQAGWGSATQLVSADGRVVGIGQATADQLYLGLFGQTTVRHSKWGVTETFSNAGLRYNPGYVQGADAGAISLTGAALALDGSLVGQTQAGPYQRSLSERPRGGQLNLTQYVAGRADKLLSLSATTAALDAGFGWDSSLPEDRQRKLALNTTMLQGGGFSRLNLAAAQDLTLDAGTRLTLGPGGSLSLGQSKEGEVNNKGNITLAGEVLAPGGKISATATGGAITLTAGAQLDVAGTWTNDRLDSLTSHALRLSSAVTSGGGVSLLADGGLTLAAGSGIDVSGGAWLHANGKLSAGSGGSIVLGANVWKAGLGDAGVSGPLQLDGRLIGMGLNQGGSLSLKADGWALGSSAAAPPGDTRLPLGLLSTQGFASLALTAWEHGSIISDALSATELNWMLPGGYVLQSSAAHLSAIAQAGPLDATRRQAMSLTLPVAELRQGASVRTDAGGSITLTQALGRHASEPRHMLIAGSLTAPGGSIALSLSGLLPSSRQLADFDRSQVLELGSHAVLDVAGTLVAAFDKLGHTSGSVLAGGDVTLSTTNAFLVTDPGSVIRVNGGAGMLDLPQATASGLRYVPSRVASDAGTVTLSSNTGMRLLGALTAQVPSQGSQAQQGGHLVVRLAGPDDTQILSGMRSIVLQGSGADDGLPTRPSAPTLGQVPLQTERLQASGFARIDLSSWDEIRASGQASLQATRSINLDSPNLAGDAGTSLSLQAPYLSLGNTSTQRQLAVQTASAGNATLSAQAGTLDLIGKLATQGYRRVTLAAHGDLRLSGVLDSSDPHHISLQGGWQGAGEMSWSAAQIYPSSLSHYKLTLAAARADAASGSALTLAGPAAPGSSASLDAHNAAQVAAPLSAGGSFSAEADTITVSGVVRAPFGQIDLQAHDTLTAQPGASLSVSGAGLLVPLGLTQNQLSWLYTLDAGSGTSGQISVASAVGKHISLQAPQTQLLGGATLDVSGGGDLLAWEWLKGPGGSKDVLTQPGVWAILPSLGSGVAPRDVQNDTGSSLQAGDAVYLSGMAGLAAGTYTLLPAHYALLPGAYAISLASGKTDMLPTQNVVRADGSLLVAGRQGVAGTSIAASRSSGFVLLPGSLVRQSSEYIESYASRFFASTSGVALPQDAGRLSLSATQSLLLQGTVSLAAGLSHTGSAGQRGDVDVSAPQMAVVSALNPTGDATAELQLDARTLTGWGAHSLLLGGTRSDPDALGMQTLSVGARRLIIANDAAHVLSAEDLVLAASDTLTLNDHAAVQAAAQAGAQAATPGAGTGDASSTGTTSSHSVAAHALSIGKAGAVLRATSATDPGSADLIRHSVSLPARIGTLNIGSGATVQAATGLHLDATYNIGLTDSATLSTPALTVSSAQINLGSVPRTAGGLSLSSRQIGQLNRATQALSLRAYASINLYGDFSLGGSGSDAGSLASLSLDSPTLLSHGGQARISANTLMLTRSAAVASGDPEADTSTSNGTLSLNAQSLLIGPGLQSLQSLQGLVRTELSANSISFQGSGLLQTSGDLNIHAGWVTASSGARQGLQVSGALSLSRIAGAASASASDSGSSGSGGLGAHLSISADSLTSSGLIDVAAGVLSLSAVHELTLASGSVSQTSGRDVTFFDTSVAAAAGTLSLRSEQGSINVARGAVLDVSGSAGGGAAGSLTISATQGQLNLDAAAVWRGQSHAHASGTQAGGASFNLDVGQVDTLGKLNTLLSAGGYGGDLSLRLRQGALVIDATQAWQAASLSFSADAGSLSVAGTLTATGTSASPTTAATGGHIELWAGQGLTLASTANLQAAGHGSHAASVTLGSSASNPGSGPRFMSLQDGSQIDLSSSDKEGRLGELRLRVARSGVAPSGTDRGGTDVALDAVHSRITGARRITIEAVQTYAGISSVAATSKAAGTLGQDRVAGDVSSFMAHRSAILQRLGLASDSRVHLTPGVEVQSDGDLTLVSDWNLFSSQRAGGEAGTLTLRSAGSLLLNASLSDGFAGAATTAALQAGDSWSYRLVAGADQKAAQPLALQGRTGATLSLAAGKLVRTGTGAITLAASGDVQFASGASAIYTAGSLAPALSGFTVPKNGVYAQNGGDVSLTALGSIQTLSAPSRQAVADWLDRAGSGAGTTSWWVSTKDFAQNVGALGGGDLSLRAGGDIVDVSAATATNGRLASGAATPTVLGGGNLQISAAGNILGGVYAVASGLGTITAGERMAASTDRPAPLLALSDASMQVRAGGDATISGAFNPTLMPAGNFVATRANNSYFSTYGEDSALSLLSVAGTTALGTSLSTAPLLAAYQPLTQAWTYDDEQRWTWYPGRVSAVALTGEVRVDDHLTLLPSAQGQLSLLAAQSVALNATLNMSGLAPSLLASPTRTADNPSKLVATFSGDLLPLATTLHADDAQPARIYAAAGSVTATNGQLFMPKPITIKAALDVINPIVTATHFNGASVSSIEAGRDIAFGADLVIDSAAITLAGPGTLELSAGRHLDLGSSYGVLSTGNLNNAWLPDQGARIVISVGLGRDAQGRLRLPAIAALVTRYLASDAGGDAATTAGYRADLISYLADMGQPGLSSSQAQAAFMQLSLQQQLPFAAKLLYGELRASGRAAAASGRKADYQRGEQAIATLFPASDYQGDLRLYLSQIKTERGGDISLLVPGGKVNEGLANPPASLSKTAAQLGIVTLKGGSVQAYAQGDFEVNQSRVFTLRGGDILIWSDLGSIDAGRGAKNTSYAPAPTLITKADGSVEYDSSHAASGSGIGVLLTDAGLAAGSVDLIAPRGTVDAGDAGIRSIGNLFIAALQVLNADNINTGGSAVGVPVQTAPAAGLTSLRSDGEATSAALKALDAMQATAAGRAPAPSFFSVEVIGYGP